MKLFILESKAWFRGKIKEILQKIILVWIAVFWAHHLVQWQSLIVTKLTGIVIWKKANFRIYWEHFEWINSFETNGLFWIWCLMKWKFLSWFVLREWFFSQLFDILQLIFASTQNIKDLKKKKFFGRRHGDWTPDIGSLNQDSTHWATQTMLAISCV